MNLWALLTAFAVIISVASAKPKCGKCDKNLCQKPPKDCPAGTVKDPCGCCDVCGNLEGDICDHPDVKLPHFAGNCGHKLECKLRNDVEEIEAVCVCSSQEALCGDDGITYPTICRLMETVVTSNKKITIKSKGPCKKAPKIFTPPEHQLNKTGSDIALACEASAYPIPNIEWTWTRVGGKTNYLPSDDDHISVNMRGGPDRYQVTGWLLIQNSQKYHEGDYTCVAQNEHGVDQATARVKLTDV